MVLSLRDRCDNRLASHPIVPPQLKHVLDKTKHAMQRFTPKRHKSQSITTTGSGSQRGQSESTDEEITHPAFSIVPPINLLQKAHLLQVSKQNDPSVSFPNSKDTLGSWIGNIKSCTEKSTSGSGKKRSQTDDTNGKKGKRSRQRNEKNGNSSSDEANDEEDESEKQPNKGGFFNFPKLEGSSGDTFDCPFFKHDPIRYRDCHGHYMRRFCDVTQHIKRRHLFAEKKKKYYCTLCRLQFHGAESRDHHFQAESCQKASIQDTGMMLPKEFEALKDKAKHEGNTQPTKWYIAWDMIFNSPRPSSPYVRHIGTILEKVETMLPKTLHDSLREGGCYLNKRQLSKVICDTLKLFDISPTNIDTTDIDFVPGGSVIVSQNFQQVQVEQPPIQQLDSGPISSRYSGIPMPNLPTHLPQSLPYDLDNSKNFPQQNLNPVSATPGSKPYDFSTLPGDPAQGWDAAPLSIHGRVMVHGIDSCTDTGPSTNWATSNFKNLEAYSLALGDPTSCEIGGQISGQNVDGWADAQRFLQGHDNQQ